MTKSQEIARLDRAVESLNNQVAALATAQSALTKSFARAIAKAERKATAKADLPSRFDAETISATSSNPETLAAEFKKFRARRAEPQPVSADNAQPIGYLMVDGSAFNIVQVDFALDGAGDIARGMGVETFISAVLKTESGDSLAAALAKGGTHSIVLQTGDVRLHGSAMTGAVIGERQVGRLAVIFTGPRGSLKAA